MSATDAVKAGADRYGVSTHVELDSAGAPVPTEDQEEISSTCSGISLYMGDVSAGTGTLFLTTRRVIWQKQADAGAQSDLVLALAYPQIVIHAISRDPAAFPLPCIYLQLDDGSEDMMMGGGQGDEEESEGDDLPQGITPELRLVPQDASKGEGDFYFNEDEVMAGLDDAQRAAIIAQRMEGGMALEPGQDLDELVGEDPGRFEDDEGECDLEGEYEEEGEDEPEGPAGPTANGVGARVATANGH